MALVTMLLCVHVGTMARKQCQTHAHVHAPHTKTLHADSYTLLHIHSHTCKFKHTCSSYHDTYEQAHMHAYMGLNAGTHIAHVTTSAVRSFPCK